MKTLFIEPGSPWENGYIESFNGKLRDELLNREILRAVTDIDDDAFVITLNEAVQLSVLGESSQVGLIRYRFTHAFFRQTLYEELIAPRRLRLHQQVARTLETQYAKRLEEHAAELAEYFPQSTDPADLEKAVKYGEMAAKRAMDVYACGEAVRLLDQALNVQRVFNPDDKEKVCNLLLDLCDALYHTAETRRILETEAPAAFSLAESIGDDSRAGQACVLAMYAIIAEQISFTTPQFVEWAERADRHARPGTAERAHADMFLGAMKCRTGDIGDLREGQRILTQAHALAHNIGDQDTLWMAGSTILMNRTAPQHFEENLRLGEELFLSSRVGLRLYNIVTGLMWIGDTFICLGQRKRAEEAWGEFRVWAERTGDILYEIVSAGFDAVLAVMDGRLDDVMEMAEHLRTRGEETGMSVAAGMYANYTEARANYYRGTIPEGAEVATPVGKGFTAGVFRALLLAHMGWKEEASEILEEFVAKRPGIGTLEDETTTWIDTLFLEAAVLAEHHRADELLLKRFKGTGLCTNGQRLITCVIRHMGGAAALLGRYDEARQYYQEAIKVCTEMPFRPELALSRLQLAELLLEHYPDEKSEALEHLEFAIKEFREMKTQPSLERALRHKDILKA